MFVPQEIIQSLTDPSQRRLILKDDATEQTAELHLPLSGPQLTWFNNVAYDCRGRVVSLHPSIRRIIRVLGIGQHPGYASNLPTPVFLVQLQSGHYAFACVDYDVASYGYEWHNDCDEVLCTNHVEVAKAEIRVFNHRSPRYQQEFSKVNFGVFEGTPLGQALADAGYHPCAAVLTGTEHTLLFDDPYRKLVAHLFLDDNCNVSGGYGDCIFRQCIISEDGTRLKVRLRAHPGYAEPHGGDLAYYHTVDAEMTVGMVRRAIELRDHPAENCYGRNTFLPFRRLRVWR